MGILGSTLGRGLAGAGAGVSQIANKYIDEDLAQQRAQVLADIQRKSTVQTDADLDAQRNAPERRQMLREADSADIVSRAGAADTAALATANNQPLTDAAIARQNRVTSGTADTAAEAAGKSERAKAENQAHDVAPGGEVIIGAGSNKRPTPGELTLEALKDGLKGKTREDRNRALEAVLKSHSDQMLKISDRIAAGIADGSLSPTEPKDGKTNPQYEAYQTLLKEQRILGKKRDEVATLMQEETAERRSNAPGKTGTSAPAPGKSPDPLGLFPDKGGNATDDTRNRLQASEGSGEPDELRITRAAFDAEPAGPDKDKLAARVTALGGKLDTGPSTKAAPGDSSSAIVPSAEALPMVDTQPGSGGPSFFERAKGVVKKMGAEGDEYNAISKRVREAQQGGAPLTIQEKALARRFGIST